MYLNLNGFEPCLQYRLHIEFNTDLSIFKTALSDLKINQIKQKTL